MKSDPKNRGTFFFNFYSWTNKRALREGLKQTFFPWIFPQGGSDHFPQLSVVKQCVFFQNCQNNESLQVTKLPPYFWAKILKIMNQKIKVTPLIFDENYKSNKSKMVFPQKQGGSGPCGKFHIFLTLPILSWSEVNLVIYDPIVVLWRNWTITSHKLQNVNISEIWHHIQKLRALCFETCDWISNVFMKNQNYLNSPVWPPIMKTRATELHEARSFN